MPSPPSSLLLAALLLALLAPTPGAAALPDEIQVYDDGMNDVGEYGLELHVNATPSGHGEAGYPGEFTTPHGVRTTLEGSYGLTPTIELGAYLPFEHMASGDERFAGPKLRLKYIPKRAQTGNPWFYGVNFELSHVKAAFEDAQDALEVRPIAGWRAQGWLVSFNPVVGIPLKPGERTGGPDFSPSIKVARDVLDGVAVGMEYYASLGRFSQFHSDSDQAHTLFLALDVDRKPLVFNFGIGRGLTAEADRWTVKAIFEIPL